MKKRSKIAKVLALCLAMVMMLSMSMTVFAVKSTDLGTITVNNLDTVEEVSVAAYKIIDVNVDNASGQPTYPMYTWADEVANWVATNYAAYIDTSTNAVKDVFGEEGTVTADQQDDFLQKMAAAIRSKEINLSVAKTMTGTTSVTFTDMEMGEYILLVTGGTKIYEPATAEIIPTEADGAWTVQDDTVNMKASENPPFDKDVTDEDQTVAIGDTVSYEITTKVPTYPADATNLTFYICDKLGIGFDFSGNNSVKVYKESVAENNLLTENVDYTFSDPVPAGKTFQINFTEDFVNANPGTAIIVTYTAVVNENAFEEDALGNDAFLGLANDPYGDDDYEVDSTVDVYTYGIQFDKVNKDNAPLSGAEFTLSNAEGDALTFTETTVKGVYNYDPDSTNTTLVVPERGSLQIQGLNVGTYTLKETKAPANYVLPTGEITITLTDADENGKLEVADNSVSSTGTATVKGQIGGSDTNVVTFDVQNTSSDDAGFQLPTTGGMGTMIFTIAGILIMAGAITMVVVISRKKRA